MNISLLCPSRGRPEFIRELIYSALETAKYPEKLEFIFYIDNDDKKSIYSIKNNLDYFIEDVLEELRIKNFCSPKFIYDERIVLSEMWNKCWLEASADIFFHCGDDIRFRTKNWDEIVLNKFEEYNDKIVFVYGRDGIQPKTFGTHGFLHRNWTNLFGYFVPPYFSSDYNDTWLNDVSKEIKRHIFVDIYTEHLHPVVHKHHWDKTHKERMVRGKLDNVDDLYIEKEPERKECCKKLIEFIKTFNGI